MDFDVIVIGGGIAGMSAAIEATDKGASVLLVEAAAQLGGAGAVSGGVIYAGGTSIQAARGINDSSDAVYNYYMALNHYKLEPSIISAFASEAAAGLEWLTAMGVKFAVENLYDSGVDGSLRGHRAEGQGLAIVEALEGAISQRNIDIAKNTRVAKLLQDSRGRVLGIEYQGEEVRAGSVILAAGGFGANELMLADLYPAAVQPDERGWYPGPSECQGDGIAMGRAVGADVTGQNRGLLMVTPGFAKEFETYLPGWLVYVNVQGERFINETVSYSVLGNVVSGLPRGECFAVFDEKSRLSAKATPRSVSNPWSNPMWTSDSLAALCAQGHIQRAETLEELATLIKINPKRFVRTIADYNEDVERGKDHRYLKSPKLLRAISHPPFYAATLRPDLVCITGAGIRVNALAEVIGNSGAVVPGLYAAGENAGGILGDVYVGGGNALTAAVVFGRISGGAAARSRLVVGTVSAKSVEEGRASN